jgi:xanthine dehydrogenase accessory factor
MKRPRGWAGAWSRCAKGLFAPVGMDLGGDGAEAIALATIAEIQACCEGKLGAIAADDGADGAGNAPGRRAERYAQLMRAVKIAGSGAGGGRSTRLGRPSRR